MKIAAFLSCIIAPAILFSQSPNLVPNQGQFEAGNCPCTFGSFLEHASPGNFPAGWTTPTNASTDYIKNCANACSHNPCNYDPSANPPLNGIVVCTSNNTFGCQVPHSGIGYVGLICGQDNSNQPYYREYIQSQLASTLVKGQCYTISYWLSLGDLCPRGSNFGVAFTSAPNHYYGTSINGPGFYTHLLDASKGYVPASTVLDVLPNVVLNKTGWTEVKFEYTANGTEKYITLGNFEDNASSVPEFTQGEGCIPDNPNQSNQTYYYLDDVSVTLNVGEGFTPNLFFSGNSSISTSTNWIGASPQNPLKILVDGTLTVTSSLFVKNAEIRFTKNSKLVIDGFNARLQIDENSIFRAGCTFMWQGIIVNNGGRIFCNHTIPDNIIIQDAVEGIRFNALVSNVNFTPVLLKGITFKANATGIYINGVSGIFDPNNSALIQGNIFDNLPLLNDPLLAAQDGRGFYGIYLNNCTNGQSVIRIGDVGNGNSFTSYNTGNAGIFLKNSNAIIKGNNFSNSTGYGIDGFGPGLTNQNTPNRFVQITNNNTFANVFFGIRLRNGFNALITSNTFNINSPYSAIQLSQNRDCFITIGDPGNGFLGNTIVGNSQPAISLFENSSTTNPVPNNPNSSSSLPTPNKRTEIVIGNNKFFGNNVNSWGIGIGEPSLGSQIKYHKLHIANNTIGVNGSTVAFGISLSNINGFYSINGLRENPNFVSLIEKNSIIYDSQNIPTRRGILGQACNGLSFIENNISTFNSLNWQNSGMQLKDCPNSLIYKNFSQAGKGLQIEGNMNWSDVFCNVFSANALGIQLANFAQLRPDYNQYGTLHGTFSGLDSRDNTFSNQPNWGLNTELYLCNNDVNQWIFAFTAPSIAYTLPLGSLQPSIVHIYGQSSCFPHFAEGSNKSSTFSDALAQWKDDYNYKVTKDQTGEGNSGVPSTFIKKLVDVENCTNEGNYHLAFNLLNTLQPTFAWEQHLFDVYGIMISANYPQQRDFTLAELNSLNTIAAFDPAIEGPGVYTARSVLAFVNGGIFIDGDRSPAGITGTVSVISPCIGNLSGINLGIVDENGAIQDVPYAVTDAMGNFAFNPYAVQALNPTALYGFTVIQPSPYAVLNPQYFTLSDWIQAGAYPTLTRAVVDTIIVMPVPDTIAPVDTVQLSQGYAISGTVNQNAGDYFVAAYDTNDNLLWSATYNGLASGADTARALCADTADNIYITGQVWNGTNFDYTTIKYDPQGNRLWIATYNAPANGNDIATAITTNTNFVTVTGATWNGNSYNFTTISYNQCPGQTNLRQTNFRDGVRKASAKLYPNPNSGTFTLDYSIPINTFGVFHVSDVSGREVFKLELEGGVNTSTISLSNIGPGVYFYKIVSPSSIVDNGKLVIGY